MAVYVRLASAVLQLLGWVCFGWASARLAIVQTDACRQLSSYVMGVAYPAQIIYNLVVPANLLEARELWRAFLVYALFICVQRLVCLIILACRHSKVDAIADTAIMTLLLTAASGPFTAAPLLQSLYGLGALGQLASANLNFQCFPAAIILFEWHVYVKESAASQTPDSSHAHGLAYSRSDESISSTSGTTSRASSLGRAWSWPRSGNEQNDFSVLEDQLLEEGLCNRAGSSTDLLVTIPLQPFLIGNNDSTEASVDPASGSGRFAALWALLLRSAKDLWGRSQQAAQAAVALLSRAAAAARRQAVALVPHAAARTAAVVLYRTVKQPMMAVVMVALLLSFTNAGQHLNPASPQFLPALGWLSDMLRWLANTCVPVALFTTGAWMQGASRGIIPGLRKWGLVLTARYISGPLLMVGLCMALGIQGAIARSLIILCTSPVALIAPTLAANYGGSVPEVGAAVILSVLIMLPNTFVLMAIMDGLRLFPVG